MTSWLAQADRLNEFQRSVRDRFQEGGSVLGIVLVIILIAAVLLGAAMWARRIERNRRPGADLGPNELFEATLRGLELDAPSRSALHALAQTAGMEHPTTMLLCPIEFDRCAGHSGDVDPLRRSQLAMLREKLFPATIPPSSTT